MPAELENTVVEFPQSNVNEFTGLPLLPLGDPNETLIFLHLTEVISNQQTTKRMEISKFYFRVMCLVMMEK